MTVWLWGTKSCGRGNGGGCGSLQTAPSRHAAATAAVRRGTRIACCTLQALQERIMQPSVTKALHNGTCTRYGQKAAGGVGASCGHPGTSEPLTGRGLGARPG